MSILKKVKLSSPATIANLVCGFDVLGMCIQDPYDLMEISLSENPGIRISHIDEFNLPVEPSENVAGAALLALIKNYNKPVGFDLIIDKRIKPGSGLGSSAASAAGAVAGANYLLGNIFSKTELVNFAMYGEQVASGVKHADNIAPCIFGGVTIIRSSYPLDIVMITSPPMYVAVVHPQIEIKTSYAREILPTQILLKDGVKQWANVAGLVAGFLQQDYELISNSLEDFIIEPVRSKLIPHFDKIKTRSKEIGALGGGISGSGPSVFMLCKEEQTAKEIEKMMQEIYSKSGIEFRTYVTTVNSTGVKIIAEE